MLPAVFDADCWAAHHDAAFLLTVAFTAATDRALLFRPWAASDRAAVFEGLAPCLRAQASIFYAGAFFWKLSMPDPPPKAIDPPRTVDPPLSSPLLSPRVGHVLPRRHGLL